MEALDGIRILFTGAADPFQKNLKLTMGAGMTATLPPASIRVGAVGGIFMVSDETKRPDEAAMRRILERYADSPEGIILRLAWLEGLSRKDFWEATPAMPPVWLCVLHGRRDCYGMRSRT